MSNGWIARIYFPLASEWPVEWSTELIPRLFAGGWQIMTDQSEFIWADLYSAAQRRLTDYDQLLPLFSQYRRGCLSLEHRKLDFNLGLDLRPCGTPLAPAQSASREYGSVSIDSAYSHFSWGTVPERRARFDAMFDFLQMLTEWPGAIYGWADTEYGTDASLYGVYDELQTEVHTSALKNGDLPRFALWNFFSHRFAASVGIYRLVTAAAWRIERSEAGWTIILHPSELREES